ncbi:hypothetical protein, putative Fumarate hydratase class II (fragment) [Bradyrhizobium sp. ORS 285]
MIARARIASREGRHACLMQRLDGRGAIANPEFVMPGLVPGIHVVRRTWCDVDGRDKPGHDEQELTVSRLISTECCLSDAEVGTTP